MEAKTESVARLSVDAVIIRKDGRREELGTIAYWHRSWWRRAWWWIKEQRKKW
jgi:hypothetical protein